ncbi:MAG: amidohydrolase family protein [Cyanobacteria bacterium P01_D01_bin.128]
MAFDMETIQLVRGRWIFTGTETLSDGAIAIQGDTIQAVGQWQTLRHQYPQAPVIGSAATAVMPGLINAHHHSNGVTNALQGVDDDFLELWLFGNLALRPQTARLRTLLSAAALLRSGVTTVLDVATVSDSVDIANASLNDRLHTYEQAGIRAVLAPGAIYKSFLVHGDGEDKRFLNTLPSNLAQQMGDRTTLSQSLSPADYLALMTDWIKTYQDHPRIDVWFGPPGPQWVDDKLMVAIADAAEQLNTGIQTHVNESFYEKLVGPRYYGKSTVTHLKDLGVLSPRFSMAHGVWVTPEDIEILASTGASVSHNPSSNLRLRAGIAPLNSLLKAGATVGLGMDGTAIGDDEDMFAEIRLAARLQRSPQLGGPAPSLQNVFTVATQGSAKLVMKDQILGKIAPGYRADLVLLNCDRITWPWIAPEADPLQVVLTRAKAADVDTVLVNGQIVLKQGQPTQFDLQAVGAEAAAALDQAGDRSEQRALVEAIKPYLAQWYSTWEVPTLEPYTAFNSKQ